jgi:hypothetical protein
MTLNNRLQRKDSLEDPNLGRLQELDQATEEAFATWLTVYAEFQYPMTKRDVQNLVQQYCEEFSVETRWVDWIISLGRFGLSISRGGGTTK